MITNTQRRTLSEMPAMAEEFNYTLKVSKHDKDLIRDLKSVGWEKFNTEKYIDAQSQTDRFDMVWLGINLDKK